MGDAEHAAAAMAVKRLHHDVMVLGPERLDLGEVARDQGRRHQIGKFGDQNFLGRVTDVARIVDHQSLGVDALKHMRGGNIGHVERRVLAQQDDVEIGKRGPLGFAQGEMVAGLIAHGQSLDSWQTARPFAWAIRSGV